MKTSFSFYLTVCLTLFVSTGCSAAEVEGNARPESDSASVENSNTAKIQQFEEVTGEVIEVYMDGRTARIKHGEIPGYMPEMTMRLKARDPAEFDGLGPQDLITFRLNVDDEGHWLDQVEKVGRRQVEENAPQVEGFRYVRNVDVLEVGDMMPNYTFTNEKGEEVELKDFHGRVVALTFIFTRCPLPDFCPRMSSFFMDAQRRLEKLEMPLDYQLFSITIDPEFDTPEVLKGYAQRYNYDPSTWSFLTAPLIDITAIGEHFGLNFWNPDGTINHNLRTVVINPEGRIHHIFIGNSWKPDQLVEQIVMAAGETTSDSKSAP